MIARMWRGFATPEKADDYVEHLQRSVVPELRQIGGFRGIYLLRRNSSDDVEFVVVTLWESMEAIRQFCGVNVETAVVAPAAQALLRAFDSTVTHYDILMKPEQKVP